MSTIEKSELLTEAVLQQDIEAIKILFSSGDSIDSKEAIYEAVGRRSIPIIDLLVENGADLFLKYQHGRSLLVLAVDCYFAEMKCKFVDTDGNKTIALAKYLVKKGLNINDVDNNGNTPLHTAITMGSKDMTFYKELARDKSMMENTLKMEEYLQLHSVCNQQCLLVQDLLSDKITINKFNYVGLTPLHLAAAHNQPQSIEHLIKKGAKVDIRARNDKGDTALLFACFYGFLECVRVLIKCKADINVRDNDNDPPILLTLAREHLDVLQYLLEEKATVDCRTFTWALKLNNAKVIKLIVDSLSSESQSRIITDALIQKNYSVVNFFASEFNNLNSSGSSNAAQIEPDKKCSGKQTFSFLSFNRI